MSSDERLEMINNNCIGSPRSTRNINRTFQLFKLGGVGQLDSYEQTI